MITEKVTVNGVETDLVVSQKSTSKGKRLEIAKLQDGNAVFQIGKDRFVIRLTPNVRRLYNWLDNKI